MIPEADVNKLVDVIRRLPPSKIEEVKDYVTFLDSRYSNTSEADESDEWSDEDLRDFTASSRFNELNSQ